MERELLALTVLERFGGEMCFHSGTTAIPKRRVFGRLATEDRGVELTLPITGGSNNPNPSLRSVPGITTIDSILTLPVEDSTSSPSKIVQVFITHVNAASGAVPANFATVILNAFGCNSGEEEEGGSRACGGDGDSFRGDEEGGGGSRTLVTGPGGSLFLIQLALPDGSSEED